MPPDPIIEAINRLAEQIGQFAAATRSVSEGVAASVQEELRKGRRSRTLWSAALAVGLLLVLLAAAPPTYLLMKSRERGLQNQVVQVQQAELLSRQAALLTQQTALLTQVKDCITPGRPCAEQARRNTAAALIELENTEIVIAWCRPAAGTLAELRDCVERTKTAPRQ